MSKPRKSLKALCKKLGVRLTIKRNGKRVYKSVKVLKEQCKNKKKKKVKRKRRRRKFGSGTPERNRPDSEEVTPGTEERNARTPGTYGSDPQWFTSPLGLQDSPGGFPSLDLSPIMLPPVRDDLGPRALVFTDSDSDEEDNVRRPSRRLQGLFNSLPRGESVNRQLVFDFGKKKKVKKRRKVVKKKKVKKRRKKSKRKRRFGGKFKPMKI